MGTVAQVTAALVLGLIRVATALPLPQSCGSMLCFYGICTPELKCECFEGFRGPTCAEQKCPTGRAWTDSATAADEAHAEVECSNMGYCSDGTCICYSNFGGGACERFRCPLDCSGRGRCISMSELAMTKDPSGGEVFPYESNWDSHQMYGCLCDEGFEGYACQLRSCPTGDDPLTTPLWPNIEDCHPLDSTDVSRACETKTLRENCQSIEYGDPAQPPQKFCCWRDEARCRAVFDSQVGEEALRTALKEEARSDLMQQLDEVQLFRCVATAGHVTLTFRGATTARIPVSADADALKAALEALPTIGGVEVSFSETALANSVCTKSSVRNVVSVTFVQDFGDLPMMTWTSSVSSVCVPGGGANGADAPPAGVDACGADGQLTARYDGGYFEGIGQWVLSRRGTKEDKVCSGRGTCQRDVGSCICDPGFSWSDGRGGSGTRGDCGHSQRGFPECPTFEGTQCSGKGFCKQDFTCQCTPGREGHDCSKVSCPSIGKAWFGLPQTAGDDAHFADAECSNMGECNPEDGLCACNEGFLKSPSCSVIDCPLANGLECAGNGRCMSMADLAKQHTVNGVASAQSYGRIRTKGSTWDVDMMYGCACDEGYTGFDCGRRICPSGDDPETTDQVHEVQYLRCEGATSGTFEIIFREASTVPLPFNVGAADLKAALLALPTIRGLELRYIHDDDDAISDSLCERSGHLAASKNIVELVFTQELGDVPALQFNVHESRTVDSGRLPFPLLDVNGDIASNALMVFDDGKSTVHYLDVEKRTFSGSRGTMENVECSGRGSCDGELGLCTCHVGYGSSDGSGNPGTRGDCGWKMPIFQGSQS